MKWYCLRAFIYPKGFFNSLLVYFSQKFDENIETLSLNLNISSYSTLEDIDEVDSQIVNVYGLYLLNANYAVQSNTLTDFTNDELLYFKDGPKYVKMPIITIVHTNERKDSIDEYSCPVYFLPRRVNKIGQLNKCLGYIDYPTYIGSPYWIMKDGYIGWVDPLTKS